MIPRRVLEEKFLKFVEEDVDSGLPFEDGTFDVVTSYHLIEHVSDTDLLVKEIYRVLKPGGYTVFTNIE